MLWIEVPFSGELSELRRRKRNEALLECLEAPRSEDKANAS